MLIANNKNMLMRSWKILLYFLVNARSDDWNFNVSNFQENKHLHFYVLKKN